MEHMDQPLIMGCGVGYKTEGGQVKFYTHKKAGGQSFRHAEVEST